eukprot:6461883-Pyramimonas_sp.AAC.5
MDQSEAGSAGSLSQRTNLTQEARVYSHDGPIRRINRGYILTMDRSDAGSAGIFCARRAEVCVRGACDHELLRVNRPIGRELAACHSCDNDHDDDDDDDADGDDDDDDDDDGDDDDDDETVTMMRMAMTKMMTMATTMMMMVMMMAMTKVMMTMMATMTRTMMMMATPRRRRRTPGVIMIIRGGRSDSGRVAPNDRRARHGNRREVDR